MRIVPVTLALVLGCLASRRARAAQDYPARRSSSSCPIRPAARPTSRRASSPSGWRRRSRRPFFVENRGGATGNIGTVAVVTAPPDGCTLLINATVIATFPHSFSKLSYDPFKDLAPVGGIGVTPTLIVAAASIPANDIKGLIEWSKTKPDGLNYSTAGYGLQQHLASEEIAQRTGAKFTHVAYRGGGTAMTDLIAARLDFGGFLAGTTKPLIAERPAQGAGDRRGQALRARARHSDHRPNRACRA